MARVRTEAAIERKALAAKKALASVRGQKPAKQTVSFEAHGKPVSFQAKVPTDTQASKPAFGAGLKPRVSLADALDAITFGQPTVGKPAFVIPPAINAAPAVSTGAGKPTQNKPKAKFQKTSEQIAIITASRACTPRRPLKVIAYAGAGKTSTLKLVATEAFAGKYGLYLAFNRRAKEEGEVAFKGMNVWCKTLDGVAWSALNIQQSEFNKGFKAVDAEKLLAGDWPAEAECSVPTIVQARAALRAVTLYCQSAEAEVTAAQVETAVNETVYRIPEKVPTDKEGVAEHKRMLVRRSNAIKIVTRFAPRLYQKMAAFRENGGVVNHPVALKIFERSPDLIRQYFGRFAYVMLDEAQDVNPVQRSICVQAGKVLIAVGDPFQQIYSWRGAENALALLPGDQLYLPMSFRFGAQIAAVANRILDSKPWDKPVVPLRGCDRDSRVVLADNDLSPAILCRTNKGVLEAAIEAIKRGRRVYVEGGIKPLTQEITSAVALRDGRMGDVKSDSFARFTSWKAFVDEATKLDDPEMLALIEAVEKDELIANMYELERRHVDKADADTVVSTTHKAKGLEYPEVMLWHDFPTEGQLHKRMYVARLSNSAEAIKAVIECYHVFYVAATRAVDVLKVPEKYDEWLGIRYLMGEAAKHEAERRQQGFRAVV